MIGSPMSHHQWSADGPSGQTWQAKCVRSAKCLEARLASGVHRVEALLQPPFSEDLRAKMRTDEVAGARNFGNLSREYPETGTLWRNGRDSRAADKSAAQVRGTASGAFADRMGGRGHQRENARTGEAWLYHLRRLHPILRQLDLLVPVELPGEVHQAVGVRASVASL
jgi:hypothetical protein